MVKLNTRIAQKARNNCEKWRASFRHNIDEYHLMHTFILGQQWTAEEEDDMIKTFRKVPLVSNKLATMANSLLGEQQQNTPQLQVVPMTNCDEEVAHIRELIIKDIMFNNQTATVYQVAASQAAIGGFGAFLIDTDYHHAKSFDLDIVYRHFKDATRCYWDGGAETPNKTDGNHCGFISRMSREKFRQMYGKDIEEKIVKTKIAASKEEIALATQPDDADDPFSWSDSHAITINDYFEREYVRDTLYKMSNGTVLNQKEMDDLIQDSRDINAKNQALELQQMLLGDIGQMQGMGEPMGQEAMEQSPEKQNEEHGLPTNPDIRPKDKGLNVEESNRKMSFEDYEAETMSLWMDGEPVRILDKRPSKKYKIIHYKIAGDYELDRTEFPSEQLPLVFVDNCSYYDKTGKQICRSFFGDCKDTQRYINYLRTQSAYILKVSRYDQWIGSKKNVASMDARRNWADPNNTQGLLAYDESPSGAKPEQVRPPELSASLFQQYQLAIDDLYTSTGLYPARMGNNGDEASGKAIDARTRQGSYPTYGFFNSINRAIAIGGEIVNEMVPRVYDTERVIALMTPDEGMKNITINREADEYGEQIENDIRKGTYEVRLKPGPSYEGQKELALQSLREVLQVDPTAFNLVADLYTENLPLSNNLEIKNRFKTLVPPEIIEAGKTGKMPEQHGPNPEQQAMELQAQAQQQDMQFKAKQLELKDKEIELKKQEIIMEAQFKIQELEARKLEEAGKLQEQELRYMAETERTQSDAAISHADNIVKILTHKI